MDNLEGISSRLATFADGGADPLHAAPKYLAYPGRADATAYQASRDALAARLAAAGRPHPGQNAAAAGRPHSGQNAAAAAAVMAAVEERKKQAEAAAAAELADDDDFAEARLMSAKSYAPAKLLIGQPHPSPITETQALASVKPPNITYQLHIPHHIIDENLLSNAQLEALTYACQAHQTRLASGARRGFLLGDGTGVGKGRTLAGAVLESWRLADRKEGGSRMALWISVNDNLALDAARDIAALRAADIPVYRLKSFPPGTDLRSASVKLKKSAYVDDFIPKKSDARGYVFCASVEGDYEYDPAEYHRVKPEPALAGSSGPAPAEDTSAVGPPDRDGDSAAAAVAAATSSAAASVKGEDRAVEEIDDAEATEDELDVLPAHGVRVSTHAFVAHGGKPSSAASAAAAVAEELLPSYRVPTAEAVARAKAVRPKRMPRDPAESIGVDRGVLFLTYTLLAREDLDAANETAAWEAAAAEAAAAGSSYVPPRPAKKAKASRIDQIVAALGGRDFDGCILLDECHKVRAISCVGIVLAVVGTCSCV